MTNLANARHFGLLLLLTRRAIELFDFALFVAIGGALNVLFVLPVIVAPTLSAFSPLTREWGQILTGTYGQKLFIT